MSDYLFTTDWHVQHEGAWREAFAPVVGAAGLRILEIGSYEGRSAVWFLENLLTGPGSSITCVDPWIDYDQRASDDFSEVYRRFHHNVEARDWNARVFVQRMSSRQFLPMALAERRKYHIIYVDGSHSAADVLFDGVLAWELLHVDGMLLFDDYAWRPADGSSDCPAKAIQAFEVCMAGRFTKLMDGSQVGLRKDG